MKNIFLRLLLSLTLVVSHFDVVQAQHSIATLQTAKVPVSSNFVALFNKDIDTLDIYQGHLTYDKSRVPLPGRCVTFNGTNQDIIGSNLSLAPIDFNTPFTVTAWVKSAFSNTATRTVFSKYLQTGNQAGLRIQLGADSKVQVSMFSNLVSNIGISASFGIIGVSAYPLDNNTWQHLCVTYDGSGTAAGFKCYVKTVPMTLITNSTTAPGASSALVATNWRVGSSNSSGAWFNGSLFDVRLYFGVAKTASEIASIYLGNLEPTGLIFKYNLDENSGTTAYNSYKTTSAIAANGQSVANGTLQNSPTRTTQGTTGGVYSFQNVNGYTLSGSVYIPKNEGVSGYFDATGAALQYRDPVRHRIRITHGVKDTINFNPYNAPLSNTVSSTYVNPSFVVPPVVPTKFISNSADTNFCWGALKDPLYVDRSTGKETNFLIYRNLNVGFPGNDSIAAIRNFIHKPTCVLITSGQSNDVGTNNSAGLLAGLGYSSTVTNSLQWNGITSTWVQTIANQAAASFGNGSQVGPDISACTDLVNGLKDKVYLIKHAQGSTSLDSNASFPYWKPSVLNGHGDANKLYPGLKSDLKAALAQFNSNRLLQVVFYWDQGENDCNGTDAPVYGANFKLLVTTLRADLGLPNMPVIVRLLSTNQTTLSATHRTIINNALIDCATNTGSANYIPYMDYYDSSNVNWPVGGDNIHGTTGAVVWGGQQIANKIITNKWMK